MGLIENIQKECVRDLPLREAITIAAECPVSEAIKMMRAKQLGCAIVIDDENKPVGLFTERTIIDLLLQQPDDLSNIHVRDHLDPDWFCVRQDEPVRNVIQMIQQKGARFFCVTEEEGAVVALTGQKGVAEYVAEHFPQQVMVQRVGGKPGQETREGA